MNKLFLLISAMVVLSACIHTPSSNDFTPKTTVRVITSISYPEFPNIEPLPNVNLVPWTHDMPRDTTVVSVKNLTTCRKIETYTPENKPHVVLPKEEQTTSWWKKCGEYPIMPNSNVFIGFSQDQWNIILEDFSKLRERNWQYKQRIIEINRQRESWRERADQERAKANGLNGIEKKSNEKVSSKIKEKSFLENLFSPDD